MGKKRDVVILLPLHLVFVAREEMVPDPYAARRRVGGGLVQIALRPAEADIPVFRDELERSAA